MKLLSKKELALICYSLLGCDELPFALKHDLAVQLPWWKRWMVRVSCNGVSVVERWEQPPVD